MAHRVLILGSTGMLGHMVEHVLAVNGRFVVRGIGRSEFNVEQCESGARGKTSGVGAGGRTLEVELAPTEASGEARSTWNTSGVEEPAPMLRSAQPSLDALLSNTDYVINCIGITARHINDSDPTSIARAIRVNAEFPHALAAAAVQQGVRVIHMSTDGVFSGTKSFSPSTAVEGEREGVKKMTLLAYAETDTPDATDTYGRTKILGESTASHVLNIRCSIIGPSPVKHEGIWEWIVAQPDGAIVDGYTNHLWHGVTTRQFAEFCGRIIAEDRFDVLRADSHILHFTPNVPVTKSDLVTEIAAAVGKRITVRPVAHAQPIRRVLAMRPSTMDAFSASQPFTEALHACATVVVA